jgi:hypothetical protein
MSKGTFSRSEAFVFAGTNTIEHFGLWLAVAVVEFLVTSLRVAAWLSFLSMSLLLYFKVTPMSLFTNPDIGNFVMGMGAVRLVETIFMWLSLKTLSTAFFVLLFLDLLSGVILMGAVQIGLDLYAKKKTHFSRLFSCMGLAIYHLIASFLYKLIVGIGLVLFIVPGVVAAVKFWFYRQALVAHHCNPIDALKKSYDASHGATFDTMITLLLLWIVMTIISVGGVGLVLALPFALLVNVYLYKKLA